MSAATRFSRAPCRSAEGRKNRLQVYVGGWRNDGVEDSVCGFPGRVRGKIFAKIVTGRVFVWLPGPHSVIVRFLYMSGT